MARPEHDGTWVPILRRRCTAALVLLDDAIRDCPDEGWTASVWPVRDDYPFVWPVKHVSDTGPGEEATQRELLGWFSAFWNVAYHALFFLDPDLSAREIDSYAPPVPFAEADHEAHVVPDRPYTRDELLDTSRTSRARSKPSRSCSAMTTPGRSCPRIATGRAPSPRSCSPPWRTPTSMARSCTYSLARTEPSHPSLK